MKFKITAILDVESSISANEIKQEVEYCIKDIIDIDKEDLISVTVEKESE